MLIYKIVIFLFMGKSKPAPFTKRKKFDIHKEIQKSLDRNYKELKKKAKKKEDLITPVTFDVLEANYQTISLNDNNGMMGPGFRSHMTGLYPNIIFKVNPQDSSIPINQLKFKGYLFIKSGDKIRAYIPKYQEKEGSPTGMIGGCECHERLYLERPFEKVEQVSRLELLSSDGKVLAEFNGLESERQNSCF